MTAADITVALAGNPNSGKTTLFNNITGARQHVGNYPGVTVEKREGFRRYQDKNLLVVDLPGTYSLTAYAQDELVARNYIIAEKPDVIVDILDASNLERNLYLTMQLLELGRPMVLALNMVDAAEEMGRQVDPQKLSQKLGIAVVSTVGNRKQGTDALLQAVVDTNARKQESRFRLDYGAEIEEQIDLIEKSFSSVQGLKYPKRWLAIKLLENDQDVVDTVDRLAEGDKILLTVNKAREELRVQLGDEPELSIAEKRYQAVGLIYKEIAAAQDGKGQTLSDRIDKVLTNRLLAMPIFLGIMWVLFNLVFALGAYPQGWIEEGFGWLGEMIGQHMADGNLKSLLVDGVIGGVGGVLVFLPNILLLFLGIAFLEDTGYMARAAFVMDRIMRAVGLHGKSFIPMLVGFGCSVPAVMGARTLENPRDRMVTILVAPLMSCSARLPVYTLLIAAFFSEQMAGTVLFSIYVLGILLAIGMAMLFRKLLFAGATEPFVMEMPPYHMPTLNSILTHMWERSVLYLKKAGTIILAVSILVWFLTNYPSEVPYSQDYDQLKTQVEETVDSQIASDVLTPLSLEKLADNPDLQELVAQIETIETQWEEESASLEPDSAELAALEKAKDDQLAKVSQTQPQLYPLATRYLELEQQRQEDLANLEKEQAGEKLALSYAGRFGKGIEPVIQPLGFDWKIGIGLFAAFTAKEVLVSTLGTIYSVGNVEGNATALQDALAADPTFNPVVAYALMAFVLIYAPCMATLAVIRRETNSWKWTGFSLFYTTTLAWIVALGIYQIGTALGI